MLANEFGFGNAHLCPAHYLFYPHILPLSQNLSHQLRPYFLLFPALAARSNENGRVLTSQGASLGVNCRIAQIVPSRPFRANPIADCPSRRVESALRNNHYQF